MTTKVNGPAVPIAEGKTKIIYETLTPGLVFVKSKDDITRNDDSSQTQILAGKAACSTATTCAVFGLLKQAGIPVAFRGEQTPIGFLAQKCNMIRLEVVVRRYAVGSYLKRFPNFSTEGSPWRFHKLVFELFLKTTGGKIIGYDGNTCGETSVEDPLILNPNEGLWNLMHPKIPSWDENSFLCPVFRRNIVPEGITIKQIEEIARKTFLLLEQAWAQLGCRLIDFKIELGIGPDGQLLVADVIDNDSWRLRTIDWQELSKQLFRDNRRMDYIAEQYQLVAKLVERFSIPQQAIIVWRGSENDAVPDIPEIAGIEKVDVVISGHKSPAKALAKLEELESDYPEGGVIIAIVGMSDGLGPILAARTSWPVIAVPATIKERPHDVWSSLELPSNVPLMTVLSPKNAVLAALSVLSQKNPAAYMHRQFAIEELDI